MSATEPRQLLAAIAKAEGLRDPDLSLNGKRHCRRFIVRGDAELQPMDADRLSSHPVPIMLRDVGRGGLGFVVQQKLEPYSTWRVCFLNHGHQIGQQAMIVRHVRQLQPGVYLIGGQFCIETGLLCMLGIEPDIVAGGDRTDREGDAPATFLAPGEVA